MVNLLGGIAGAVGGVFTNVLGNIVVGPLPTMAANTEYLIQTAGLPKAEDVENRTVSGSMANKNFRFNPPLHPLNLPKRVDFATTHPGQTMEQSYLDEQQFTAAYKDVENVKQLRLGRIIQHENAAGMAAVNAERYGFRFLYNPSSVTLSSSRNDSVILDSRSSLNAVISGINQNFQTISLHLLLNRMPDVMMKPEHVHRGDYVPAILQEDLDGIRRYGTHWDLEILYRVCNGIFNLDDRGKTGDIGTLLPSNARLILGPEQDHFGFVQGIAWNDLMFSVDMIPVRTEVEIVFRRHVDMAPGALFTLEGTFGLRDTRGNDQLGPPALVTAGLGGLTLAQEQAIYDSLGLGSGVSFTSIISQAWRWAVANIGSKDDEGGDGGGGGGGGDEGGPADPSLPSGTNIQAMLPAAYWNKAKAHGQKTVSQAIQKAHSSLGDNIYAGRCIQFVTAHCYGHPSGTLGFDSAYQCWTRAPNQFKHRKDFKPPAGAVVLWSNAIGGGHGHAAVSAGDGWMYTTTTGPIKRLRIDSYSKSAYYGWIPPVFNGSRWPGGTYW